MVQDTYEPGSTFKMVTAAAALNESLVKESDTFFCENGTYEVSPGVFIHDHEPAGTLNLQGILEHSSNIGAAKVVERVGNKIDTAWRPVSDGATIDFFDCEVYQVAAAYMMQVHTLPARAVIDARRQEIQNAAVLEAQQTRDREAARKLEEESETGRRRPDDGWTPTPFKL